MGRIRKHSSARSAPQRATLLARLHRVRATNQCRQYLLRSTASPAHKGVSSLGTIIKEAKDQQKVSGIAPLHIQLGCTCA